MMALSRFRPPKTGEEEEILAEKATPKSTKSKNKWARSIFEEWQRVRASKLAVVEVGLFKDYEVQKVQPLSTPLIEMDAMTLNYWMSKFVQEVSKSPQERYPPKTLYQIVCGIRRDLIEKKPTLDFNPLDSSDKR